MCWEKKTHLSKGLCGSEPYIAPELFDQKGSSDFNTNSNRNTPKFKSHAKSASASAASRTKKQSGYMPFRTSLSPDPSPPPSPSSSSSPKSKYKHEHRRSRSRSKLIPVPEYDARQVDVWAAAVVFYCMQFQELPWRVAKNTDPTYNSYRSQYGFGTTESATATPPPLNNLMPRECRNVIKHMLDPDPQTRWSIDQALNDKWIKSITVCKEGEVNDHAHTTAGLDIVKV